MLLAVSVIYLYACPFSLIKVLNADNVQQKYI